MKRIVVAGGGSAGWLTADYLAAKLGGRAAGGLAITLVEAQDIPTIGVGEATTPSLRATMADIGLDEYDFMRACNASFKHGILFVNWARAPQDDPADAYFHPFERPLRAGTDGLETYWLRGLDARRRKFEDAVSVQRALAELHLAPKTPEDRPYDAPIPYAYHVDAGLLADALKQVGKQRGVTHVVDRIVGVEADDTGLIRALRLAGGGELAADLFIDCSGFAAILIEKHYRQAFTDRAGVLFCDAAVTCQAPHPPQARIPPFTRATARPHGWIWDISLASRRGTGYVFSTRHVDEAAARRELAAYLGPEDGARPMRCLRFRVGYRAVQWFRNCVAAGLSGGFIEPLESTGIHLVEQAAWALASMIPRFFNGLEPQAQFNALMASHYEMALNFVKYHYLLSQRADSPFWTDNVDPASWTPWLRERVARWRGSVPDIYDLDKLHSIFDHASYQYVYFGMRGRPALGSVGGTRDQFAATVFERVAAGLETAKRRLPGHAALLDAIHRREGAADLRVRGVEALARVNASIRNIPNNDGRN